VADALGSAGTVGATGRAPAVFAVGDGWVLKPSRRTSPETVPAIAKMARFMGISSELE
jgi:hypothetical protein